MFLCKLELENKLMIGRVRSVERKAVVCRLDSAPEVFGFSVPTCNGESFTANGWKCCTAVPTGTALCGDSERDILFWNPRG